METLISVLNFEQAEPGSEINSPRTLEACLRAGYDPSELLPKQRKHFKEKGLTDEMIDIKFQTFERKRQGLQCQHPGYSYYFNAHLIHRKVGDCNW